MTPILPRGCIHPTALHFLLFLSSTSKGNTVVNVHMLIGAISSYTITHNVHHEEDVREPSDHPQCWQSFLKHYILNHKNQQNKNINKHIIKLLGDVCQLSSFICSSNRRGSFRIDFDIQHWVYCDTSIGIKITKCYWILWMKTAALFPAYRWDHS